MKLCMSVESYVSLIVNIILAAAAIVTAFLAYKGLKIWRDEASARNQDEVARRLLLSALRLRGELGNIRRSIMVYDLTDIRALRDAGIEAHKASSSDQHDQQLVSRVVYSNRWSRVNLALDEFEATSMEAEMLLGSEIAIEVAKLKSLTGQLWNGIAKYIRNKTASIEEVGPSEREEVDALVFDNSGDDEFASEVEAVVMRIRELVQPHLLAGKRRS